MVKALQPRPLNRGVFKACGAPPHKGSPKLCKLTVAIPASVYANVLSPELRAAFIGSVGRALAIYGVDEVVIFEDTADLMMAGDRASDVVSADAARKSDGEESSSDDAAVANKLMEGRMKSGTADTADTAGTPSREKRRVDDAMSKLRQSSGKGELPMPHVQTHSWSSYESACTPRKETKLIRPHLLPPTSASIPLQWFVKGLMYLDTPPFLRKAVWGWDKALGQSGLMAPLDSSMHAPYTEQIPYREGVVVEREFPPAPQCLGPRWEETDDRYRQGGSWVDCGCAAGLVWCPETVPVGARVVLALDDYSVSQEKDWFATGGGKRYEASGTKLIGSKYAHLITTDGELLAPVVPGRIVPWRTPAEQLGQWPGFQVRAAKSLRDAISGGYDLILGTSDKGQNFEHVESALPLISEDEIRNISKGIPLPPRLIPGMTKGIVTPCGDTKCGLCRDEKHVNFKGSAFGMSRRVMVVFGGRVGLEAALRDPACRISGLASAQNLFDAYLNLSPLQASRTIRCEEAILMGLAVMDRAIRHHNHLMLHGVTQEASPLESSDALYRNLGEFDPTDLLLGDNEAVLASNKRKVRIKNPGLKTFKTSAKKKYTHDMPNRSLKKKNDSQRVQR